VNKFSTLSIQRFLSLSCGADSQGAPLLSMSIAGQSGEAVLFKWASWTDTSGDGTIGEGSFVFPTAVGKGLQQATCTLSGAAALACHM